MRRKIILFIINLVICSGLFAQNGTYPDYQGYVNDFARVIDAGYRDKITALAGELEEKTGAQLAVAAVSSLEGRSVEMYAAELFARWGVGQKRIDNGLLILFAVSERQIRIEVGDGLEGIITDGTAGEILDRYLIPDFRAGDYGRGLYRAAAAVSGVIAEDAGVQITGSLAPERSSSAGSDTREKGGGAFFIIMILLIIFTRGRILPWLLLGSMFGGGRSGGGFSGGGFSSGGFGGGFGGFGGGMSSGGGASRGF